MQGRVEVEEQQRRRRDRSWRVVCGRLGWNKVIRSMVKGTKLTAPSFLVSDVTAPGDEVVALQEVHELWIGQGGAKTLVSARKAPE